MHWRITLEAVDPIGDEYRKEFMTEKNLDGLADGKLGRSIDDGKAVMKEVQKNIIERQLDLWVRYCRVCPTCDGLLPIKDYIQRRILTIFGEIPVRYPRLMVCQKCNPACCFTFSPAAIFAKTVPRLNCWSFPQSWAQNSHIVKPQKSWRRSCRINLQEPSPRSVTGHWP